MFREELLFVVRLVRILIGRDGRGGGFLKDGREIKGKDNVCFFN